MPCNTAKDLVEDEQLRSRDFFVSIKHDALGREIEYPGQIARINGQPVKSRARPPWIGEHNEEVYRQLLGLPLTEQMALRETGVI
jgi:crotonobetainyl-CoA:carnitine CoA-transferase CaiB-like acyl-CoA transferase